MKNRGLDEGGLTQGVKGVNNAVRTLHHKDTRLYYINFSLWMDYQLVCFSKYRVRIYVPQ